MSKVDIEYIRILIMSHIRVLKNRLGLAKFEKDMLRAQIDILEKLLDDVRELKA